MKISIIFAASTSIIKPKNMDAIITFIVERWPWLVAVIVAVAVTIWICKWYFGRFVPTERKANSAESKLGELEALGKTVAGLPCAEHDEAIGTMKEDLAVSRGEVKELGKAVGLLPCIEHGKMFSEIMEAITEIRTFLMVKNPKTAAMFALKHSPLSLNEEGERLFADVSGGEFLSVNKEALIACIDEKTPKTALDVEESALMVLYDHLDDDMFNGMKKWVYNSPSRKLMIDGKERDYTVTMNDVCFVLSIPLRDMYLEIHPELQ